MLNQSNTMANNNKFYVIQLLTAGGKYYVWCVASRRAAAVAVPAPPPPRVQCTAFFYVQEPLGPHRGERPEQDARPLCQGGGR